MSRLILLGGLLTIVHHDRETRPALDNEELLLKYGNLPARRKRKACDVSGEVRKKQKTLDSAARDIGNAVHGQPLSEPLSARCVLLIHVSKLVLYTITYTATRHPFSAQRQTHSIIYSTIHRTPSTMMYDYQQMINLLFQVLSIIPV